MHVKTKVLYSSVVKSQTKLNSTKLKHPVPCTSKPRCSTHTHFRERARERVKERARERKSERKSERGRVLCAPTLERERERARARERERERERVYKNETPNLRLSPEYQESFSNDLSLISLTVPLFGASKGVCVCVCVCLCVCEHITDSSRLSGRQFG